MLKRIFFSVLLAGVLLAGAAPAGAGVPGELKWTFSVGSYKNIYNPAVGADGTIYVTAADFKLHAVNPADGSEKWAFMPAGGGVYGSPALDEAGIIYVTGEDAGGYKLYAVLPTGAAYNWAFDLPAESRQDPAIGADGTIYVSCNIYSTPREHKLYAVKPDGAQKWVYTTTSTYGGFGSPAVAADGTVYVASTSGALYGINPGDGTLKYFISGNYAWYDPVLGADGTVYFSELHGTLFAWKPGDIMKWILPLGPQWSLLSTAATAVDGTIYVSSSSNQLYAVNPGGTQKWSCPTGTNSSSVAVGADGTIYLSATKLSAINPASGNEIWAFTPASGFVGSSPAVAPDGTIYVGGSALYAVYSDSLGLASSSWPMSRHDLRRTGRVYGGPIPPIFGILLLND